MIRDDLSIACFLWGDWCKIHGMDYVEKLRQGVKKYLPLPHRFICFTDKPSRSFHPDVEVISIAGLPDWQWNLRKMYAYYWDNGLTGRVLLFDLDVIITGDLSDLANYKGGDFITCKGAYTNKAGGSLMSFPAGRWNDELWLPLVDDDGTIENKTRGSERKYYQMAMKGQMEFWQDLFPGQVLSYKVDCNYGVLPHGARVVRFHGQPRPHEAKAEWIGNCWA